VFEALSTVNGCLHRLHFPLISNSFLNKRPGGRFQTAILRPAILHILCLRREQGPYFRAGGQPHQIELQFAHAARNAVSAAHNHTPYLEPRTKMMQEWADFLEQTQRGGGCAALPWNRSTTASLLGRQGAGGSQRFDLSYG
jgi:hypothetical protein